MPKHKGIFRKGDKWYGAKWWKGKTHVTRLCSSTEEAVRALEDLVRDLRRSVPPNKEKITLKDFSILYFRDYVLPRAGTAEGLKRMSLKVTESRIRTRILSTLGDRKLRDLGTKDLDDLASSLIKRYSANYTRSILISLKRILKAAYRWKYLGEDLGASIVFPRGKPPKPRILSVEQLRILIGNAEPMDRAIIALGALGGLRRSEIFGLKWEDVDFRGGFIRVRRQFYKGEFSKPKTEKSTRVVPILPDLKPILQEWKLGCGSPNLLFPGSGSEVASSDAWVQRKFHPLLARLGLPRVLFHSLRHLCDKILHDMGIPTRDVMQILGHTSYRMTIDLYDRESPERLVKITRECQVLSGNSLEKSLENHG
jgi:integrase